MNASHANIDPTLLPSDDPKVIIVGAGMAGLELAKQLALLNVDSVWVVESGGDEGLLHNNLEHEGRAAEQTWLQPSADRSFYRPWSTLSPPHFLANSGLRRRLGGRSLYWHGVILPIEEWALREDHWPLAVIKDLSSSWLSNEPLYIRLQRELLGWAKAGKEDEGSRCLADHMNSLGVSCLIPAPRAVRLHEDGRWEAYSPLSFWSRDHRQISSRQIPFITTETDAIEVLSQGGRATGLRVRSRRTSEVADIRSPAVVVAAGTIESSRIIAKTLWNQGEFDTTFTGLADHLVQGFVVRIPRNKLQDLCMSPGNALAMAKGTVDQRSNVFFNVASDDTDSARVDVWCMGEQDPNGSSSLLWNPESDEISARVELSQRDRETLRLQGEMLEEIWSKLGRSWDCPNVRLPSCDFWTASPSFSTAINLLAQSAFQPVKYACPLGTIDHESGSLRMGRRVSEEGEVFPGLYVLGPCTFPRLGAANPSLTTLSLARRLAFQLRHSLRP